MRFRRDDKLLTTNINLHQSQIPTFDAGWDNIFFLRWLFRTHFSPSFHFDEIMFAAILHEMKESERKKCESYNTIY